MVSIDVDGENNTIIEENLALKLTLESDGKKAEVYASNIEMFELEYHPYGFEALVHFSGFDNSELEKVFDSEKKMSATLAYQTEVLFDEKKDPVEIQGMVYERVSRGIEKKKKEVRAYLIKFADGARESWSQHFPKAVHIEKTMKDVIDAEKNPLVNIEYDWELLTEDHPIIAYNLESFSPHQVGTNVSFYSFLMSYLEQEGGILEYNYKENKYKLLGKKSAEGEPVDVSEWWVTSPRSILPQPPRWVNKEMKSFPDRIEDETDENEKGYDLVRKDWIDKGSQVQFPEQGEGRSKSCFQPEKPEVTFWVKEFKEKFQFDQLFPGTLMTFKGREKIDGQWCEHPMYKDKVYRLNRTRFCAKKLVESQGVKVDVMPYGCEVEVVAEDKEEPFIPRPLYARPQYPFYIPGEVFCDIGDDEQTTSNVKKDEKTSLRMYQVKVPLSMEEEKYVICPYSPDYLPGHFYFRLYKKQQVMLAMWFNSAKIHRILDHQPHTESPEDDQKCQIVFESNGLHKYTLLKCEYENGEDPILTIKQSSSEEQTQLVTIKEKETTLTVEEKDKCKTTVQLHRDEGLLVERDDKEGKMTHSSFYESAGITHTSKGDSGASTIVQKPESIEIKADTVTTNCDEFVIDAKKAVTLKAASKVLIDTPLAKATQEMTVG